MAHVEAGAPVMLFHAFTQGHVPLPGATGTAVEKIKVLALLRASQDTIRKACRVQRRAGTDTRTAVEDQVLSDQLGLSTGGHGGTEILGTSQDCEHGLQACVQ